MASLQGVSLKDYGQLAQKHIRGVSAYTATGNSLSVLCGRVSYTFWLKGAAVSVDTACSSSLVSMHMACSSLVLGQSQRALNAGINLTIVPETTAILQRAGMMSLEGRCKTLDAAADGYVRAESVATALLQAATPGGAGFCALLRGSAVNQGGRSSTLTAPNGPSQQDVIRNALREAGASPGEIAGLHMHGTGESLRPAAPLV